MVKLLQDVVKAHENIPPDWYYRSIRENIFQRFWHKVRFYEASKFIEGVNGKVLDIGSADGVFTHLIAEKTKAKYVEGIDVLKNSVDWANKHWKSKSIKFKVGNAESLNYEPQTFETVFAMEVLEHVGNPSKVLTEIKRVLKNGGYAVFLVPTNSFLFRFVWFFWTKIRGKIWKDTHIQTYRNNYLERISKKAGFKIEANHKFMFGMLQIIKVRK